MSRSLISVSVWGVGIAAIIFLQAQGRAEKAKARTSVQGLSDLRTNVTTDKLRALTAQPLSGSSESVQAVAQFLELSPDQVDAWVQLLEVRQSAVAPLLQNIAIAESKLNQLLNSGGAPADVGALVIQIHALQQQVMLAQQSFLSNFQNLLDPDQRQKLEAVHLAAQLQPIVPYFEQLALL
jgi:hypothetical protein